MDVLIYIRRKEEDCRAERVTAVGFS